MSWKPVTSLLVGLSGFLLSTAVSSAGTLTLYNWESYTSPELLASFEQAYDIKVRLIEYRTSEAALSEIRDGRVQADLAVVASNFLPACLARSEAATSKWRHRPGQLPICTEGVDQSALRSRTYVFSPLGMGRSRGDSARRPL